MVSRKSKSTNTAKLSYDERAACALHALQKSRRRGGHHLASIKAQVRKDAEERKDKLGPQWTSWVTKAVNRLLARGLLVRSNDSPTHFELSSTSKKILKGSERTLSVTGPHSEELLAKHLLRATAGMKCPGESEIDSTPTKKSRTTSPSTATTKPVLVAEIEWLRHERLRSLPVPSRSPSPLTDLDDDEDPGMLNLDEQAFSSQDNSGMDSGTPELPTRPSSPDQLSYPSTPVRAHESSTRHRPLLQVTRTHSGSYIANGRPTPEPPEPVDRDSYNMTMDMDNGYRAPVTKNPIGLATPGTTPARTTSYHENNIQTLAFREMMADELARISEENKQLRVTEADQLFIINDLNSQIQSLQRVNANNEERATILAAEISTLQAALAQSTQRSSSLNAQLSAGMAEIASLQASVDMKDQETAELVQKLQDANSVLEASTEDLYASRSIAAKLKENIGVIKTQMDNREIELTSKLKAAEQSMEASAVVLQQRITRLDSTRVELQEAQESIRKYMDMLDALKLTHVAELDERSAMITSLHVSLSSAENTVVKLRSEMDQSADICAHLRGDIEQAASDRTRLGQELATERLHSASVKGELDQALFRISEAEKEIEEMETLRTDDAATITKLRNTIERIHAAQMEQWAGITQEVTQASPAPRRPRFSL